MSETAPFFSVVIPVTRPHCLRYSLASVLDQEFTDFEVVVSHNTPAEPPSLDWLPSDMRIRYVRPDDMLPQHDHWEFALAKARGQWVMLLGDDDAITPSLLRVAAKATTRFPQVPIIYWTWCNLFDVNWSEPQLAGAAGVPPYTAGVTVTNCRDYLELIYKMDADRMQVMKRFLPSIMRGMYRRDVIDKVRSKTGGRLCKEWTPDYSAAAHAMSFVKQMLLIDIPLLTLGSTRDSMAATYAGAAEFYQQNFERAGRPKYKHTVIQSKAHSRPLIAETLMIARETLPDELSEYQFDMASFLNWHHAGLMQMKALGRDIASDEAEFERVMSNLDADTRRTTEQLISSRGQGGTASDKAHWLRRTSARFIRRALRSLAGRPLPSNPLLKWAIQTNGLNFVYPKGSVTDIHRFVSWIGPLLALPNWDDVTINDRRSLLGSPRR
jgi:glycosyltransferase involved in cell wall biosynthesis